MIHPSCQKLGCQALAVKEFTYIEAERDALQVEVKRLRRWLTHDHANTCSMLSAATNCDCDWAMAVPINHTELLETERDALVELLERVRKRAQNLFDNDDDCGCGARMLAEFNAALEKK